MIRKKNYNLLLLILFIILLNGCSFLYPRISAPEVITTPKWAKELIGKRVWDKSSGETLTVKFTYTNKEYEPVYYFGQGNALDYDFHPWYARSKNYTYINFERYDGFQFTRSFVS